MADYYWPGIDYPANTPRPENYGSEFKSRDWIAGYTEGLLDGRRLAEQDRLALIQHESSARLRQPDLTAAKAASRARHFGYVGIPDAPDLIVGVTLTEPCRDPESVQGSCVGAQECGRVCESADRLSARRALADADAWAVEHALVVSHKLTPGDFESTEQLWNVSWPNRQGQTQQLTGINGETASRLFELLHRQLPGTVVVVEGAATSETVSPGGSFPSHRIR